MKERITFSSQDHQLSGLLESPDSPIAYALFAHCFTCGKDVVSASRISRSLMNKGIAVLRFDFTGLGSSDGDFANTNFSSNLQDLISAANFLTEHYQAPKILIGHSLGGAAVLAMANQIKSAKAIVTLGAPANAHHVTHNFSCNLEEINDQGEAEVILAGRKFKIKKQFLEDVAQYQEANYLLGKALLVMHSPIDTTVDIKQAEIIYKAARHPKSFISLDNADHLLTKKSDAEYAAGLIAAWVSRYL